MALGGALIGAVGSVVAGNRAADAQESAAQAQVQVARETMENQNELSQPYRDAGGNMLQALQYELLGGERPVFRDYTIEEATRTVQPEIGGYETGRGGETFPQFLAPREQTYYTVGGREFDTREAAQAWIDSQPGTEYQGYQPSQWYQHQFNEGLRAIDNSAASRGNLFSGATLKASQRFGTGLASADYQNYLSRLAGGAGMGQAAAANQAANMGVAGQNISNAYGAAGNAQAASAINTGNALANLGNNVSGWWGYQTAMNGGQPPSMSNMFRVS